MRWAFFSLDEATTDDDEIDEIMPFASKTRLIYTAFMSTVHVNYGLFACIIDSPGFVPAVFW